MTFRITREDGRPLDRGDDPTCPYAFAIWGHAAQGTGSHMAIVEGATISFAGASFEVTGTSGTLTMHEQVTGPANSGVVNSTDTITASCTKDP